VLSSLDDHRGKLEKLRTGNIVRYSKSIQPEVARAVHSFLSRVLGLTKYAPNRHYGLDGTSFHVSARASWSSDAIYHSGHVWSPKEGTKTRSATHIAFLLLQYAKAKETEELGMMREIQAGVSQN
jgi:hypothetical protein